MENSANDTGGRILRELVSGARALIANQVGFSVGCYRMNSLLREAEPFGLTRYQIFRQFYDETRHLPTGSERLNWDKFALLEKDKELLAICYVYVNPVLLACYDIIENFDAVKEGISPVLRGESFPTWGQNTLFSRRSTGAPPFLVGSFTFLLNHAIKILS